MNAVPKNIHEASQKPSRQPIEKDAKLDESLKYIENFAKEKGDDLRNYLEEKYENIETAVEKVFGPDASEWIDEAKDKIQMAKDKSQNFVQESRRAVSSTVQANPWAFIAGGIALGFLGGFLARRK